MLNNMVFDRTAEDVANKTAKGLYRYTDLNRVQNAVTTICGRYAAAGYDVPDVSFTTWSSNAIPRQAAMDNYINSVIRVRGLLAIPDRPRIYPSMGNLTYEMANNIEKLLWMMDEALDRVETSWWYCGEIYTGEVDL